MYLLRVPHFPEEDKKLRASKLSQRRGGNCGNMLEILEQLVLKAKATDALSLHLLSVLPAKQSVASQRIRHSFKSVIVDPLCIYRDEASEAASSYIIQNEHKGTRTIVSYNELPEMTKQEFAEQVDRLGLVHGSSWKGWFHFEVTA
jgi:ketohexokinase